MNGNIFLNGQLYIHQNKSSVKKEIGEKKSVLCFKPLLWHYHYLVTLTMELLHISNYLELFLNILWGETVFKNDNYCYKCVIIFVCPSQTH